MKDKLARMERDYNNGGLDACENLLAGFQDLRKTTRQVAFSIEEIETIITEGILFYRSENDNLT